MSFGFRDAGREQEERLFFQMGTIVVIGVSF